MMLSARLLLVGLLVLVAAKTKEASKEGSSKSEASKEGSSKSEASKEGSSKSDALGELKRENTKLKEELAEALAKLKSEAESDSGSGTCVLPDEMQSCTVHGVPYLCGRMLGVWAQNHFLLNYVAAFKPKIQEAWEATKKAGAAAMKYRDVAYAKTFAGVAHVVEKIAGAKKMNVEEYTDEGQKIIDEKMKLVKEPMNKVLSSTGASDKLSVSNAKAVGGKVVDFMFNKFAAEMEFAPLGKKVKFGHGIVDIVLVLIQAAIVIYGGIVVGIKVFRLCMAIGWTSFKINFWLFMTLLKRCVCPAITVSLLFVYGFVGVTAMHILQDKKGAGFKIGTFSLDKTRDRLLLGWAAGAAMWALLVLIMFKICGCYVLFPCCMKRSKPAPSNANASTKATGKANANGKSKATGKASASASGTSPASGKAKSAPYKK